MQGLVLDTRLIDQFDGVVDQLLSKIQGCSILLADISGRLISVRNTNHHFNPTNLAALTAGNMAATSEIAKQIGEQQPFQLVFHEGKERNIYLSDISGCFLLVVVFDQSIQIGAVRLFTRQAVKELLKLTDEFRRQQAVGTVKMDKQFSDELSTEIEDIFKKW